jgi:hypothetical protein
MFDYPLKSYQAPPACGLPHIYYALRPEDETAILVLENKEWPGDHLMLNYKQCENIYYESLILENKECPHLHYGVQNITNSLTIIEAQEKSTELIIKYLTNHSINNSILEVGIGLGTTLNKLQSCGYNVKGISPHLDQITQSNIFKISFEDYITTDTYNHILFQESAQYIDPSIIVSKSYSLLEKQGQLLIMDEFSTEIIPEVEKLIEGMFKIEDLKDLTKKAKGSITYLIKVIEKHRNNITSSRKGHIDGLLHLLKIRESEYNNGTYKYLLVSLIKK